MAKKSKNKPARDAREEILVSLQEEPKHLEEVGSRVVADRLTQVAGDHLLLAKEDEAALAPFGFDAHWLTEMGHALADLKAKATDPHHHVPTSPELEAALANARQWISRYLAVVKNSGPRVRKDAPKVSHHDHSPRVLANQLEKLSAFLGTVAKETARHGGGKAFADLGVTLAQSLAKARSEHNVERGALPAVVQDTHAAAGLVYAELVRLSRAAHEALGPARAKLYSLATLHRHHGHAAADATSSGGEASKTTAS